MRDQDQTAIQEVLQTECEWVEAHRWLDIAAIDRLMGDDYTIIQRDGTVVGKEKALASYKSQKRSWETANSDDYSVRIYGDTAIVMGRWTAKGTNAGEAFDYSARFMAVYVKRGESWQIVADQSTPIAQA